MGDQAIRRIVVVGGGTAGWLSACLIAARSAEISSGPLEVTLVESPDVPTIGVGEGTWPTMRRTLRQIGIAEPDFLAACDASFKQGSRFVDWRTGQPGDSYHHPFTPPADASPRDLVAAWQSEAGSRSFADTVSAQPHAARSNLAPRQRSMPDYAGALNYAYHFDAGRFAALLARHGTDKLGVRHLRDHVTGVERKEARGIAALHLRDGERLEGDLFIDCSGHSALLIGQELGVPFRSRAKELFNDRALAVQVPVLPGSPIASETIATAHQAGWLWDIGLPGRRGIGCVYSSDYLDDAAAEAILLSYVQKHVSGAEEATLTPRKLQFHSGHRERFWEGNCLAVGLSAGFLEPLEASAIVTVELSLEALLENFPAEQDTVSLCAKRFNTLFSYRWQTIIEFLKLHYVLSQRTEPYWQAHRDPATIPVDLAEQLKLWRSRPPGRYDFPHVDEIFPAASYQYVLYGMGFPPPNVSDPGTPAPTWVGQIEQRTRALAASLPSNRAYLDALRAERSIVGAVEITG